MRTSQEIKIIYNQQIQHRSNAFRIRRANSLPTIHNDSIIQVSSPRHDVSSATDRDIDLVTTISLPTTVDKEEPKTCCTQPRSVMIAACITASAVTTASILTAIVTLVVHFAT